MKKSLLTLIVILSILLVCMCFLPTETQAASSGYYSYRVFNGEATIAVWDTSISGDVILPSTIGGYPVTRIDSYAFRDCTNLTSITIPDSITSIGDYAFYYCTSLTNITIPDSVTSIGDYAFYWCTSLTGINIPERVTSIGQYAFYHCTSLTGINIPERATNIGQYAFCDCTSLTSITIPVSVTSIGDSAFLNCPSLTGIWVDSNNTYYSSDINGILFNKEKTTLIWVPINLNGNYTIPDGVTTIGNSAFYGCSSLTVITIPDSVTYISSYAFFKCSSLTSITIPDGVTSITTSAFENCTSLTSITIPDSVTTIGSHALRNCTSLTSITIPESITSIGRYAFYSCTNLTGITIPDNVTYIGDNAFRYCTSLTSITIPDSVTRIDDCTFYSCVSLTNITIPDSVTGIGDSAFHYCTGLTTVFYAGTQFDKGHIVVDSDNTYLTSATWHYGCHEDIFAGQQSLYCIECDNYFLTDGNYALATITFCDWNGAEISTQSVQYNGAVMIPSTPTRQHERPNIYQYVFDGWDREPSATCDGNATYIATYKEEYIDYTVLFVDEDGTELSKKVYHWGDKVTAPTDPAKAADKTYTYAFAGWDKEVVDCEGDVTYTATYASAYIDYTVIFVDEDGSELSKKTYHWGDKVTAPVDPAKVADNTYTYAFSGWDEEVVDCVGDAVYTATYTATYIEYSVVFKDYDGAVISRLTYHYGDAVTIPTNPVRVADNVCTYIFAGWDKEVVNCAGEATYTATYTPTYIDYTVIFADEDGTELSKKTYHYGDAVEVPTAPTKVADNTYSYAFAGWDKGIVDCAGNAIYTATYMPTYIDYTVVFVDEDGTELSKQTYHWGDKVTAPTDPTKVADNTYSYSFAGWDKEIVDCAGNAIYTATYMPTYIDYTVVFVDEDGTELSKKTYHWGDKVTAPVDPAKIADNTYTYAFSGWDEEVVDCAGDATYTAIYTPSYIDYLVVFRNWNSDVLSSKTYHYGESIEPPADPMRAATNTFYYTFAGWDKAILDCTGDAIYTATYAPAFIDYTVIFIDEDGTELSMKTYHWGDKVTAPTDPAKVADNTYTYAFSGWDEEVVNCAGEATYTATYTPTYIDYIVIFADEDGTELSKKTYHYGDAVEVPTAPTKVADKIYTYAFAGWDKEVVNCAGDVTYIATYAPTYKDYTVIFVDEDGSELSKQTYHWGDKVTAPTDPAKVADNTYAYTFAGWDKEIVNCAGDATYTARYTPIYIEYTVTFQYADGTPLSVAKYHYGDAIIVPENPTAPKNYAFVGWDKKIVACVGDVTYIAVFELVYAVGDVNGNNVVTDADALYLLRHTLFPERYPINQEADFNGDGEVTDADALYLLRHTLFPERYPLQNAARKKEQ